VLNHIQDRLAGSARGFTIVIHGGFCGRPRAANLVSPAYMARVRVIFVGTGNTLPDLITGADRIHSRDEATLLHFRFPLEVS
jgi:hypothetical protein